MEREFLYTRHKLSHQQIDHLLADKESTKYPELKGQLLGKVNDFISVTKLLSDNGIIFIPLKGPMLSYRIYGDPSFRYFSDLDLLMELPELKKALAILLETGYQPSFYNWPQDPPKEKLLVSRDNQFNIEHAGRNIGIELHWRPFHYTIGGKTDIWPLINNNLDTQAFAGAGYTVFNRELELLYLVIHGGLHAFRWLKWLVDVKDLLAVSPPDPGKFNNLSNTLQARRMVALCNALLQEHFPGTPLLPGATKASGYLIRSARKAIQEENILPGNSLGDAIRLNNFRIRCFPGFRYRKSLLAYTFYSSRQLRGSRLRASMAYDLLRRVSKKIFHSTC